jgi:site-specific DNA-cytosine methylase
LSQHRRHELYWKRRRLPIAIIEDYAGVGTFLAAYVHLGGRAHSASEKQNVKHPVLRARNPAIILREFAAEPAPLPDEHYVLVCAGLQCQPFAPGGSRLAEDDPRAVDVTDTIYAIVERLEDRYAGE